MKKILVTGAAGFIGYHFADALLRRGYHVVGLDNVNAYYDVSLKRARLAQLTLHKAFEFLEIDMSNRDAMVEIFSTHTPNIVVNLAAQAGVRYSIDHPHAYVDSNLQGFMNILEGARRNDVEHLIYASSSSVYGANTRVPFSTAHAVDHPISLYAATKKAGELMAHTYAHLYRLPCTGLRFFTVYGPWGRPDMAVYKFTKALVNGAPIDVYNHGDMMRDFTYIDDIIAAMMRLIDRPAAPDAQWNADAPNPHTSNAPYRLYNIGNNNPENLMDFIHTLEDITGKKAQMNMHPMQAGDVQSTYADTDNLSRDIGFKPSTNLRDGLEKFVQWYTDYHGV